MNRDLARFLDRHDAVAEEVAVWGDGKLPLQIVGYLSHAKPPKRYVTSIRCVVFREDSVLVVRDPSGSEHIVPGGRVESGEIFEDTLRREVMEETGWKLDRPAILGFSHFHHLSPKPPGHPYPHPDFIQVAYVADAVEFVPAAMLPDEYVNSSEFRPMAAVLEMGLPATQRAYLTEALRLRG